MGDTSRGGSRGEGGREEDGGRPPCPGQPSDVEVIRRCRRGEVEVFRVLVERYQDRIYNLSFRLLGHADDALDAAQETFVRVFAALKEFDPSRPFAPWLYRIATNACYGMLRRRRPGFSLDAMEETMVDETLATVEGPPDPLAEVERTLRDEAIQTAVLALPEPYRAVVLLHYLEEFSCETIATILEMPVGTVKTHLHRARQRLRRALMEDRE